VTTRFERPGSYPMFCHEYCGIAHHTMWGKVIVEPTP
jgi:cytochrome c oxidase subunit II